MKNKLMLIAKKAGRIILRRAISTISSKEGHANFVTDLDQRVQDELEHALLQLLPGAHFIGEEKENDGLTDAPTWIVDPIDGTTNLIHDYRMSAVSIALCEGRKPILGLIWQPFTQELFYAEKGKGAFLNDTPIHVSDTPYAQALVAVGTAPYNEELRETGMALAEAFLRDCADIRRTGSAALDLAYLACGRIDAFYELLLKPWDYAAGSLIVQEAGGIIRMPLLEDGLDYGRTTAIVAATSACIEPVMTVIRDHMK